MQECIGRITAQSFPTNPDEMLSRTKVVATKRRPPNAGQATAENIGLIVEWNYWPADVIPKTKCDVCRALLCCNALCRVVDSLSLLPCCGVARGSSSWACVTELCTWSQMRHVVWQQRAISKSPQWPLWEKKHLIQPGSS